mmetsp:Transcript_26324/g.38906  ORF Transcript_26324/g.38906 Transcript_26324/m.38906 type:complete len:98 (-) Transcript_26324:308-601(-)
MLIPTKPTTKTHAAPQAPSTLLTLSPNTKIPQQNDEITMRLDHVPTLMASPALRMPYIPAVAPGTQNAPLTIPHGVNLNGSPSGITSQHVRKQIILL